MTKKLALNLLQEGFLGLSVVAIGIFIAVFVHTERDPFWLEEAVALIFINVGWWMNRRPAYK